MVHIVMAKIVSHAATADHFDILSFEYVGAAKCGRKRETGQIHVLGVNAKDRVVVQVHGDGAAEIVVRHPGANAIVSDQGQLGCRLPTTETINPSASMPFESWLTRLTSRANNEPSDCRSASTITIIPTVRAPIPPMCSNSV